MTAHISGLIETISIKSGGIKLVLWIQTFSLSEGMRTCKCFPRVIKLPTLMYNRANTVIRKDAINFDHFT
jgi:hypothetical protein